MLRDRLDRHLVWLGQLIDGRIRDGRPGSDVPPRRIRQRGENPRKLVRHPSSLPLNNQRAEYCFGDPVVVVNPMVENTEGWTVL
jgi:hypothetical protein